MFTACTTTLPKRKSISTISCSVHTKKTGSIKNFDPSDLTTETRLKADKYLLRFSLQSKYGDVETYPNIVITIQQKGEPIAQFILVANKGEYGAFHFGKDLENHGRCDAL
jgi:hypothetical protein